MKKGCSFYNNQDLQQDTCHGFQDDQSEAENIVGNVLSLLHRHFHPLEAITQNPRDVIIIGKKELK